MKYLFFFLLVGLVSCGDDSTVEEKAKSAQKKSACECFGYEFDYALDKTLTPAAEIKGCEWIEDVERGSPEAKKIELEIKEECLDLAKKIGRGEASGTNDCGSYEIEYLFGEEQSCEGDGCECRDDNGNVIR